jgi:hypothetical protein
MKKNLFYYLFAVICSVGVFTSCSDDDDPDFSQAIEQEIAGTYKGTLDISLDAVVVGKDLPKNIAISKAGNSSINLELKDFIFNGMNLGTIQIMNCTLAQNGSSYTFTGSQTLNLTGVGECAVTVENSTIAGGKATVNLNIDVKQLKQTVKVLYVGTRLKGTESNAAQITSFTFDKEVAAVDSLVIGTPVIDEADKTITFVIADTAKAEHLKMLVPTITVSDKAIVTPGSGIAQNFNSAVKYTVIAEDGTENVYTVSVSAVGPTHDFEEWSNKGEMYDDIYNPIGWATCNSAVALIKNMGPILGGGLTYEGEYPVRPTSDCVSGENAILMESVDTKGGSLLGQKIPKVTAGTAFLGSFNAMAAIQDPMATTSFGVKYNRKPLEVTGYFKYTAGADFYNEKGEKTDDKDECAISAVLYEVENDAETLNGTTIYTSDKIVASAMFTNGGTKEYTPFKLELKYIKDYDATKKYKLAVIFAASKEGAAYRAAVGSTLCVDKVIIVNE